MRPRFNRLVEDIKNGEVDVVVVWDIDRLTRRPLELEQFAETCEASGMTEDIHTISGPVALLFARIKGAVAAEEARKTAERVTRKKLELAHAGKPHGGSRAFGYEKDGITVIPTEAELIKEAAARILGGDSLHTIRHDWQERGVKTTTGKLKWSVSTLKRSLTSPKVAGLRQYQGEVLEGVEAVWDAILDRETWEQLRVVLLDPKRFTGPRTQSYPLNGVLVCGLCGEKLKAMPRQRRRCYGCKKETGGCGRIHVRSERIEEYLYDLLVPMADSPDLRDVLRSEQEGGTQRVQELLIESAKDEAKLAEVTEMLTDGDMDKASYVKASKRIRDRIQAREAQLTTLRGSSAVSKLGGNVAASWDGMSAEDKRSVIMSLVTRVEVNRASNPGSNKFDPDRVNVVFRYDAISKLTHLYRGANGNWRGWVTAKVSA